MEKVAPWLTLDRDPYPVVVEGRIKWVVDGYTLSNEYPYSSRVSLSEATSDSVSSRTLPSALLPRDQANYIRNSVKAVVDAYDGTVTLYAWDATDPVLQTWMKAFPGVVEPLAEMDLVALADLLERGEDPTVTPAYCREVAEWILQNGKPAPEQRRKLRARTQ